MRSKRKRQLSFHCGADIRSQFSFPTEIACRRSGEAFVLVGYHEKSAIAKISTDGTVALLCQTKAFALALDEESQKLFLTCASADLVKVISLLDNSLSTIAGSGNRGNVDGIGILASFNSPRGIAQQKTSGDLFVVDENRDHVRKLSRVIIDGTEQWMVSSIRIGLQLQSQEFYAIAVLNDRLFLTSWDVGTVVQSSLDGKSATVIAQLPVRTHTAIAATTHTLYASICNYNAIRKIELQGWFWSTENHRHLNIQSRQFMRILVVAALCNSSNSMCQLRKLPREILFHLLSFLDSHSIKVSSCHELR
jgi:DNA-binding beta-propeller fold protein YncE